MLLFSCLCWWRSILRQNLSEVKIENVRRTQSTSQSVCDSAISWPVCTAVCFQGLLLSLVGDVSLELVMRSCYTKFLPRMILGATWFGSVCHRAGCFPRRCAILLTNNPNHNMHHLGHLRYPINRTLLCRAYLLHSRFSLWPSATFRPAVPAAVLRPCDVLHALWRYAFSVYPCSNWFCCCCCCCWSILSS